MKHLSIILFLVLIVGLSSSNGQTKIIGKITDSATAAVIPFATIKYMDSFISADDNGVFIINTKPNVSQIDSIIISCVGYAEKKVNIFQISKEDTIRVKLNIGLNVLNEVVVVGNKKLETDPYLIIKIFANKFSTTINNKPYDCKLLYREFSEQNKLYMDFVEASGLKHFEGNSDTKLAVKDYVTLYKFDNLRGVNSKLINTAIAGYHPATWQIAADYIETILYNYLRGNFVEDIKFNLDGIISNNDHKTYIISFEPKKRNWGLIRNIYGYIKGSSGIIYLNADDYAIEKVKFSNLDIGKIIKLKNTKYKNELTGLNGNINYVNINGRSTPSYIEFNYLFKDLSSNYLITKKMQYYFSDFNFDGQSTAELATRYGLPITKTYPFRGMSIPENIKFYNNPVYNPVFWKNELGYPGFWDLAKVTRDFKKQNLVLEDEFKKFDNKLNPQK